MRASSLVLGLCVMVLGSTGCTTQVGPGGSQERVGQISEGLGSDPNGAPCTSDADCASGYCYPGPDQDYCMAETSNCARPGTDGILYGATYTYDGVTYACVYGVGLEAPPYNDGAPCTSDSECSSTFCYPGPDQSYCIAESANCAQPGTGGAQYGSSYTYRGVTYACVYGVGLEAPPYGNGAPCTSDSECGSGYCYPGPDQSYCIAASANCAQPGTNGARYGSSYTYEGVTYTCVYAVGLESPPYGNGAPCTSDSECASLYCYPGPDQSYCISATANCAQPGTGGAQYGSSYTYEGFTYACVYGVGLESPPYGDGAQCTSDSECSSTYCYPGPDQSYCIAATANCAQPGTGGVPYGSFYTYKGVTYACVYGVGLESPPYGNGAQCKSDGECGSGYCYPGPDQSYCIAATSNCAEPGGPGIQYGHGYLYGGVTYSCVQGEGLETCISQTCAQLGYSCPATDNCGLPIDCGTCTSPQTCGGAGQPGVCGGGGDGGPSDGGTGDGGAGGPCSISVNQTLSAVNGIQQISITQSGTYTIVAAGAQGGSGFTSSPAPTYFSGGQGAVAQGQFTLIAGDTLQIVVGSAGATPTAPPPPASAVSGGGGGGGTFVYRSPSPFPLPATPLLVGGGGGGGGAPQAGGCGGTSVGGSGNGGTTIQLNADAAGGGGVGWLGAGQSSGPNGVNLNGGSQWAGAGPVNGGYGGGGGALAGAGGPGPGMAGGAGGGGYTGGNGGDGMSGAGGSGGSSFVDASVVAGTSSTSSCSETGDGYVQIVGPLPGTCPSGSGGPPCTQTQVTAIATGEGAPLAITVDDANVYWTNGGGTLRKCGVGQCQPQTLATGNAGGRGSNMITVDGTYAYWADYNAGQIKQVPLAGGTVQVIDSNASQPVAVGLYQNTLFYTVEGANQVRIAAVPLCDGCTESPGPIALNESGAMGLAVAGTLLYWTDAVSGAIGELDLTGGSPFDVIASGQSTPSSIASDGTYIYWTNNGDGTVMRAATDGSGITQLASGQGGPMNIAVDSAGGNYVYYTNFFGGQVMKVSKNGGTPVLVANGMNTPDGIAARNGCVYWTSQGDGKVWQAPD